MSIGTAPNGSGVEAERREMGGGLDADELAADFVAGAGFPFEQVGRAALPRQTEGGGGTCRPPPTMAASQIT